MAAPGSTRRKRRQLSAEPDLGVVSVATELLQQPAVAALINAILAETNDIDPAELRHQIVDAWTRGIRPVRAVADKWGPDIVTRAAFRHVGYPSRTPDPSLINIDHAVRIPLEVQRRRSMVLIALDEEEETAEICAADPTSQPARDDAALHLRGYTIRWLVAPEHAVQAAVRALESRSGVDQEDLAQDEGLTEIGVVEDDADSNIASFLDTLFNEAIAMEASDIHLFPNPSGYEVRFRRDGVLIHREDTNVRFGRGLVSRIRVLCELPMSSNTKQDGGAAIKVNNRRVDLRISIIPSIWDLPAVTIRVLASRTEFMQLDNLYSAMFRDYYLRSVDLPDGFNLVVGRTGDGKPVSADAIVLMGDGSRKRLGEIVVGDSVITHQGRPRKVLAVYEQGLLPGVEIETIHGRSTAAALDHPFLTPTGWIEAGDLEVGMSLANVTQPTFDPATEHVGRSDAEFALAGLMVRDGSSTGSKVMWTHRDRRWQDPAPSPSGVDDQVAKALMSACDELGFEYHPVTQQGTVTQYALSGAVSDWLRDVGLAVHDSKNRAVPEFVFTGTDAQIATFLGTFLATDGAVKIHEPSHSAPRLKGFDSYSSNRGLLAQVQHLLLRLGIQSFLSQHNVQNGTHLAAGHPTNRWRLFIGPEWDACGRLAERVPIPGPAGDALTRYAPPRGDVQERLLGDEITTITRVDSIECRCLTVEADSTFTADDLVVHNTTTLAATLNAIATPDRKACSIEDPVENRLPHIVQVQVNEKAGLTYEEGLRAFLRSDPDIIMVGEIRDRVTAEISIQAAQTGHLVFGTLHIRDAAAAAGRLVRDFHIEPAAVADTLNSVLAQRLLRTVCRDCRVPFIASDEDLHRMNWPKDWPTTQAKFVRASTEGCDNCKGTGYRGRKAAPELLVVTAEVQQAIVDNLPAFKIREIALSQGMVPMWNTALGVAAKGETTFDEILRVLRS